MILGASPVSSMMAPDGGVGGSDGEGGIGGGGVEGGGTGHLHCLQSLLLWHPQQFATALHPHVPGSGGEQSQYSVQELQKGPSLLAVRVNGSSSQKRIICKRRAATRGQRHSTSVAHKQRHPTRPTTIRTPPRPPPPIPSAPRSPSSRRAGKAPSRSKQRRVAPGHTKWGLRGHRSRGTRGLIRPDKTAIPTSRSRGMSGGTWSFARRVPRAREL